jgi:hypothetical protein
MVCERYYVFIVCSLMHSSQHVLKVVPLVHYGNAMHISTSCDTRHKLICHLSYIHSLYIVANKIKYQTHIIEGNKGRPSPSHRTFVEETHITKKQRSTFLYIAQQHVHF